MTDTFLTTKIDATNEFNHITALETATGMCLKGNEPGMKEQLRIMKEIVDDLSEDDKDRLTIDILANLYLGRRLLMRIAGNP